MSFAQLFAYGAQNMYLSGNPKITFFKAAYMRTTNNDRLEAAANRIQTAWRRHDARRKRKAVAVIELHVLHHLYKPCGRLAPRAFSAG